MLASIFGNPPVAFECSNCGSPWWQDLILLVTGLASLIAVAVAVRSLRHSRTMLALMWTEHELAMKELSREPELEIKIHWAEADPDVLFVHTPDVTTNIWVGVTNKGERWIENAVVNVLFPALLDNGLVRPYRVDKHGVTLDAQMMKTGEPLPMPDETETPAAYFDWTRQPYWPDVSVIHMFQVTVSPEMTRHIPMRVEITDERGKAWEKRHTLHVVRRDG